MIRDCSMCVLQGRYSVYVYINEANISDNDKYKGVAIPGRLFLKYDTTTQNSDNQNCITELSYDAPQFLCLRCNDKYLNAKYTANVLLGCNVINIDSKEYTNFLANYPTMTQNLGIGNYLHNDKKTKSAFERPEHNNLMYGESKSFSFQELMEAQNVQIKKPPVQQILNAINNTSNNNDFNYNQSCEESNSESEQYDPAMDSTNEECNESKDNKKYTIKEARALLSWMKAHPLSPIAKEEQLNIFKSDTFKKHMKEHFVPLRKPKSYINLYAL